MDFKKNAKMVTDDLWYELLENGGHIELKKIIADKEQLKEVQNAIKILQNFEKEATEKGVLELF